MTMPLDPAILRQEYDAHLRGRIPEQLPVGASVEIDGPLLRVIGLDQRGFIGYVSVADVDDLDVLIARQRDFFTARGEGVEWKLHGHDLPADLPERLAAAGFVPEEQETVVIGLAQPLAAQSPPLPPQVRLREVTDRVDLDRIAAMETAVWGDDRSFLAEALEKETAADPTGTTIVVAETSATSAVLSAGWIRYMSGTPFATLWGGSTLPQWRRQGLYQALVCYRAQLAVARGVQYLQVDASDDSRPILLRRGFVAVTTTTPYVHPAPPTT